jgi:hypothetical protein
VTQLLIGSPLEGMLDIWQQSGNLLVGNDVVKLWLKAVEENQDQIIYRDSFWLGSEIRVLWQWTHSVPLLGQDCVK